MFTVTKMTSSYGKMISFFSFSSSFLWNRCSTSRPTTTASITSAAAIRIIRVVISIYLSILNCYCFVCFNFSFVSFGISPTPTNMLLSSRQSVGSCLRSVVDSHSSFKTTGNNYILVKKDVWIRISFAKIKEKVRTRKSTDKWSDGFRQMVGCFDKPSDVSDKLSAMHR